MAHEVAVKAAAGAPDVLGDCTIKFSSVFFDIFFWVFELLIGFLVI